MAEAFPEIKPVIVVATAFIVLCDQLKLPGFIDVQRTSSHDVQPIGVLQAGLGVIKQGGIAVTVKPAAKFLICHGKTSGNMLISAGDSGNAFIVIFTAAKATFGASLKLHYGFRLAFFCHDVDQATGTAAAVQGRRTGDHFNTVDIKGSIESSCRLSVREELRRTPSTSTTRGRPRIHTVVGAASAADVKARDQLSQCVFKLFAALNLLFQFGVFDNPVVCAISATVRLLRLADTTNVSSSVC